MPQDDKRLIRKIKKAVKRDGNRHRRRQFERDLRDNPEEAHRSEENLGGSESKAWNRGTTGIPKDE